MFDGIKDGIANVFKTVVNAIIRGINKVIAVPFNAINSMLNKIRNKEIAGIKPFTKAWKENPLSVPQIPELYEGAVLKRGQVGILEGRGDEAVVPLHNNKKWIRAVAQDMEGAVGTPASSRVESLLVDILTALEEIAQMGITLDTGALVGGLARPMDRRLGQIQAQKARV